MPTYEYQCSQCGHEFEEFQSITAPSLRKCPQCEKNTLKRLIGCGGGVIFKGSGFYETDYRSDSYKKSRKSRKGNKNPSKKSTDSDKKKNSSAGKADTKILTSNRPIHRTMVETSCPICGKKLPETETSQGKFYPFCSDKCRLVDLGRWFNQDYCIKNTGPEQENTDE